LAQPGTGDAGGMNVYVLQTALQMARRGVEVEIFTRATSSADAPVVRVAPGVLVRNVVAGPFAARGGKSGASTPIGTFTVQKKVKNYWSKAFDAPMPNSVFFQPGIAFHADNPKVASNGCVHLTRSTSQQFFNSLQPGDPVQIVS